MRTGVGFAAAVALCMLAASLGGSAEEAKDYRKLTTEAH